MTISDFIEKAEKYDKTNLFGVGHEDVANLPEILQDFYKNADPLNVEVPAIKYGNIQLFSFDILQNAYKLYGFFESGTIVFASANGDPFFILDNAIYTTYESDYKPEFVSSSMEAFLSLMKL